MILYPIQGKYKGDEQFDISIVVPMYKSREVIVDQIRRWPTTDKGLKVEIIYVDDACPQKSYKAVIREWGNRRDAQDFHARIIINEKNKGFGGACNSGAHYAKSKYVIFLNADTVPEPNWLHPIYETFENDPKVGIVGNLQLKEGGEFHGTIDSAGSEWYWPETNFLHIGRHIFNGEILEQPMKPREAKLTLCERQMVTGCCLAIPTALFKDVGGFNQYYHIGYWEDSELNMNIREKGYKVMFQPKSIIWHKLSHAKVGKHDFHDINKQYFMNKWDASGRIDQLVKESGPRPLTRDKINLILVKRQAANGDVLLAAGVLGALKKRYPDARIHFCTGCPATLFGHPYINHVINEVDAFNFLHRYNLIVELDDIYEARPTTPLVNAYAEEAGIPVEEMEYHMHHTKPSIELPENYVVVHAGMTNWVGRQWKDAHFEAICKRIMAEGHNLICIGSTTDREMPCTLDLRGKVTLFETAWVIKHAKFYIGIDSMPMHIAQTFDVEGACFFGCIKPEYRLFRESMKALTAPNLPCLGCHHRRMPPVTSLNFCETGGLDCEEKLTVEMVWSQIKDRLCKKSM